ncbi:hypothetical protein EES45_23040 [Streptomyces sp. ADI97-07]|nr:hypothetical protein EES45_23040 [Streptomyces sp. ADI97-07]
MPSEAEREHVVDRRVPAPTAAVLRAQPRTLLDPVALQLQRFLVRSQLPQLHAAPQTERRHRGEQPPGEAHRLDPPVGRDLRTDPDRVPCRFDDDDEQHGDHCVHAGADRVRPRGRRVERDRRRREQPRRVAQQRERHAYPRQQQVEGEQHTDTRVDPDREHERERAELLLFGEVAHRGVRADEPDRGEQHAADDQGTDESALRLGEVEARRHESSPMGDRPARVSRGPAGRVVRDGRWRAARRRTRGGSRTGP